MTHSTSSPVYGPYLGHDDRGAAFPFVVEPFSEDYHGQLAWHFMGNHLLRCASLHAGRHGFGYDDMQTVHHAWVLSRLVVELDKMPTTGQEYTIETWVNRAYRQFTDRLFAITGTDGTPFGYGFSTWALIDTASRRPMNLDELPNGGFTDVLIDRSVPIAGPGRIALKGEAVAVARPTCYSDIDINGHVNSIRYIEMMLDTFPRSLHDHAVVRRLEVAYSAEAYLGDVLTITTVAQPDGHTYHLAITKEGQTPVVKAAITFAPL